MKKFNIVLSASLLLLGLQGCQFLGSKTVSGTILDASMNTITLQDKETLDTLSFSTMSAEKEVEDGILIGDYATVTYKGGQKNNFKMASKIKVKAMPELRIMGSWIQPIPGMESQNQGIKIMEGGKAESINMHTLLYNTWKLTGPNDFGKYTLTLTGRSIGNDSSFDFTEEYTVDCYTGDVLTLSSGDVVLTYSKSMQQ